MIEINKPDQNTPNGGTHGHIQIADEVVAIIAGTAVLETEGIYSAVGNIAHNLTEFLGLKDFSKGVKIAVEGNEAVIELSVLVKYGYRIPDVMSDAQRRVKNAIETMTGLVASTVNINVTGLVFDKEKKDVREHTEK